MVWILAMFGGRDSLIKNTSLIFAGYHIFYSEAAVGRRPSDGSDSLWRDLTAMMSPIFDIKHV
jgi:hypothetical protein